MLLSALAPLAAAASQSGEIVVTGHGLPQSAGDKVYSIVEIDRSALRSSASNRLDEILKTVPGVQLFRRSDARSANPTSQGVTLRALGGNASSRVLLMLDGLPQSDPFGGWISWPAFDPQRLGSARVVRGGGSGVNGPGALAGTIELESAQADDVAGLSGSLFYGSRDSIDAHAVIGGRLGDGFASLSGRYARGDGFVPIVEGQRGPVDRPAPYEQASIAARAAAPLSGSIELQASGLFFNDGRERGTAFSDIETRGTDAALRLVGTGRWAWSALGYVQTRRFYNSFASVGAGRATVSRASEQYHVPSTGLGARLELRPPVPASWEVRIGADWRQTSGQSKERFSFQNGTGTRGRAAGGSTHTLGSFAEAAFEHRGLTLTAGARIDRWIIEDGFLAERIFATGESITDLAFPDRDGWEPTGRAGIAFDASRSLRIRGAAYLGWRLPTLNELYRPFRVGTDATAANAALGPERLRGIEAGIDLRPIRSARIGVTLFANRLTDGIANVTLGRGPGTFPGVGFVGAGGEYRQRQNIDAINSKGIEVDAAVDLDRWSLSAGYSFADAEVQADGPAAALDRRRPAQTPRHNFSSTAAWQAPGGARGALQARYVGSQYEDDLGNDILPDALTFDVSASLPLSARLTLEARAENITDAQVAAAISSGIVERATPRTFWIGLRLSN